MNSNEIWDPLRKKAVARTPEEGVRQWFVDAVLKRTMGVPEHLMMSEVGFSLGEKRLRADIVVYGRDAKPLAVVECKRPDVELSGDVLMQVVRYNMILDVKYVFITNGKKTVGFARDGDRGLTRLTVFPGYEEMCAKPSDGCHSERPE